MKEQNRNIFISLTQEEFEQLPKISIEELQKALDEGHPDFNQCGCYCFNNELRYL